jgi:hypothetical protein
VSPASPGNTGDGLRLAEQLGADVKDRIQSVGYCAPISRPRLSNGERGKYVHVFDFARPGVIAINPSARRFVNEAVSYHDLSQAIAALGSSGDPYAFLICDHIAIRRFGLGYIKPFPVPLLMRRHEGYLISAGSMDMLARKLAIDPQSLQHTISTFNTYATAGRDQEFGRPASSLKPLIRPPFHAIKIVAGVLGTFVGLKTNSRAAVLDKSGGVIDGLFAVGNDMASIFGGTAPGAGCMLGPALTFGYIAGKSLATSHDQIA